MGYLSNIGGYTSIVSTKISKTDAEWRAELTPEQYDILRAKGTERPFSGEYVHTKADGTYCCAACGAQLFSSKTKFESRSEEHTSELQSHSDLVCRLLLEKKK